MNFLTIFFIAIGLSVDSLAASLSTGVCMKAVRIRDSLKIAFFMAFFQGSLPVVGWFAGAGFQKLIADYDHWIAFILLLFIGGKMIFDGATKNTGEQCFCPSNNLLLIGMSLATSIDALIVGVGFGLLNTAIMLPAIIIFGTTFLFSFSGIYIGHHIGHKIKLRLEIVGGLILIGLGVKILFEHLYLT